MKHKEIFTLILPISVLLTICTVKYFFPGPSFLNVSAAETVGQVGVYWDRSCGQSVYSISWGVLTPGEIKRIAVYVRNEGNETCLLILTPENWNPDNASDYLSFSWDCEDNRIEVGEIVKVTLTLLVSPNIVGVTDFSFDVIFKGRKYYFDEDDFWEFMASFIEYYKTHVINPEWDLDGDYDIDEEDLWILYAVFIDCWKT